MKTYILTIACVDENSNEVKVVFEHEEDFDDQTSDMEACQTITRISYNGMTDQD